MAVDEGVDVELGVVNLGVEGGLFPIFLFPCCLIRLGRYAAVLAFLEEWRRKVAGWSAAVLDSWLDSHTIDFVPSLMRGSCATMRLN